MIKQSKVQLVGICVTVLIMVTGFYLMVKYAHAFLHNESGVFFLGFTCFFVGIILYTQIVFALGKRNGAGELINFEDLKDGTYLKVTAKLGEDYFRVAEKNQHESWARIVVGLPKEVAIVGHVFIKQKKDMNDYEGRYA